MQGSLGEGLVKKICDSFKSFLKLQASKEIWLWIALHLQVSIQVYNPTFSLYTADSDVLLKHLNVFLQGVSITACCGTGRHIVALEENKAIFHAILKPMRKSTLNVVATAPPPIVAVSQDPDDMLVVPRKFVRKGIFSK